MKKKSIVEEVREENESEKAKKIIEKERQTRIEKCKEEIDSVMGKYKCTFQVQMIIEPNRNIPVINIVAN